MSAFAGLRVEVASAARRLAQEGLLIGTAGNLSVRDPESGHLAVTATGVVLGDCEPEQVCVVSADGELVAGEVEPTSELALHLAVLASGAGAVVHTHAPAATAVSCVREVLPVIHYQQLILGGEVPVVGYARFGSAELADSVAAALVGRSAALMANHGAVTTGANLKQAVENALLLEWCSRLLIDSSVLGEPRFLDESQQRAVIEEALRRSYGTVRPARPVQAEEA